MTRIMVHEFPLAEFGDAAGGFRQKRYPGSIVIPLVNKGQYTIVDEPDYPMVDSYRWNASKGPNNNTFTATTTIDYKTVRLHSLLTGYAECDHIDRNPLNNSRSNLRSATTSLNAANRNMRSDNTSGYKGVVKSSPNAKRWTAQLNSKGKHYHLGQYDYPEDAARAYDEAARELFGDFARLNFPRDGERSV